MRNDLCTFILDSDAQKNAIRELFRDDQSSTIQFVDKNDLHRMQCTRDDHNPDYPDMYVVLDDKQLEFLQPILAKYLIVAEEQPSDIYVGQAVRSQKTIILLDQNTWYSEVGCVSIVPANDDFIAIIDGYTTDADPVQKKFDEWQRLKRAQKISTELHMTINDLLDPLQLPLAR